jgi:hypothetical protein
MREYVAKTMDKRRPLMAYSDLDKTAVPWLVAGWAGSGNTTDPNKSLIRTALSVFLRINRSWDTFIERMLAMTDPALLEAKACGLGRVQALEHIDLLYQTAHLTSGFVRESTTSTSPVDAHVLKRGTSDPIKSAFVPVPMIVPGTQSKNGSVFICEPVEVHYPTDPELQMGANVVKRPWYQFWGGRFKAKAPLPPYPLATEIPYVARLAAISSAAGAVLASPALLEDVNDGGGEEMLEAAREIKADEYRHVLRRLGLPPKQIATLGTDCVLAQGKGRACSAEERRAWTELHKTALAAEAEAEKLLPRARIVADAADGIDESVSRLRAQAVLQASSRSTEEAAPVAAAVGQRYRLPVAKCLATILPAILKRNPLDAVKCFIESDKLLFAEMSVCAAPRDDAGRMEDGGGCTFPHGRYADGGYTDNMATANAVSHLQRRAGAPDPTKPLRLVIVENDQKPYDCACGVEAGESGPPPCELVDVLPLFSSPHERPGDLVMPYGQMEVGFKSLSASVFTFPRDHVCELVRRHSKRLNDQVTLRAVRIDTKTIENKAYGVEAGWPVQLLLVVAHWDFVDVATLFSKDQADFDALASGTDAIARNRELDAMIGALMG